MSLRPQSASHCIQDLSLTDVYFFSVSSKSALFWIRGSHTVTMKRSIFWVNIIQHFRRTYNLYLQVQEQERQEISMMEALLASSFIYTPPKQFDF
jgi:hypothetical protein